MNIQVALLPNLISAPSELAIIIDTLRFTTTACQAFKAGAHKLHVASEIDQIRTMRDASSRGKAATALCGERHGHRIDGFDLGNSPYEYTEEVVGEKSLFFTTTNGTRAISAAQEIGTTSIWLAAVVNRQAVAQRLLAESPETVQIICAGTDGQIALEDVLAAGAIMTALQDTGSIMFGDGAAIASAAWASYQDRISDAFETATGGRNLIEAGYERDLDFAAQVDALDLVPANSFDAPNCFQCQSSSAA